jgi:hypothetical protein
LSRNVECVSQLHRSSLYQGTKRLAINKFGGDEMSTVRFPNFMNGQDVGMIQR